MCSAIILGFFRDLSLQIIPWYVGFFPWDGWFLGFSFAEEKKLCSEYWMFHSRHVVSEVTVVTVFFSFWLNRLCRILIVNITARHDLS